MTQTNTTVGESDEPTEVYDLKNVSFRYKKDSPLVLDKVSCKIQKGDFVGIMGDNGSGKTTFVKLLAGFFKETEGEIIRFNNEDIAVKKFDPSKLGFVFQFPEYQLFEPTVEEDVSFGLKKLKLSKTEIAERVKKSLELVGFDFEKIRKKSPLELSGGEKKRVAIAGVLAPNPDVIIFDEPIAGLDSYARRDFLSLLKKLNDCGKTIILISHNTNAVYEYANHLIIFENGKIIFDGLKKENSHKKTSHKAAQK